MTRSVKAAAAVEDEPLVDLTQALERNSKKLDRQRKKQEKKAANTKKRAGMLDLPYEIFIDILGLLRPSDIFRLSATCKGLHEFINDEQKTISKAVVSYRYVTLSKCFGLPIKLEDVDPAMHPLLQDTERQEIITMKKKAFQHIKSPDETLVCTCLTCLQRWNALNFAIDFNYWQDNLDDGEPIPMIARGKHPEWNRLLLEDNVGIVFKAMDSPLWHIRILEKHLDSTIRSIIRQRANKGNQRRRFRLSDEDVASGTDLFLERSGPPTLEIPHHRDQYYLLETCMPGRSWNGDEKRWMYMPETSSHENDLAWVVKVRNWKAQKKREQEERERERDSIPYRSFGGVNG